MPHFPNGFRHIHLELAREAGHPAGDSRHGYDILAPLAADDTLDTDVWRRNRQACRVRRFRPGEEDAIGTLSRKPGGQWFFDYADGDSDDELGFRLDREAFVPGEYVSIRTTDGKLHSYRIASVRHLDASAG